VFVEGPHRLAGRLGDELLELRGGQQAERVAVALHPPFALQGVQRRLVEPGPLPVDRLPEQGFLDAVLLVGQHRQEVRVRLLDGGPVDPLEVAVGVVQAVGGATARTRVVERRHEWRVPAPGI